MTTDAMELSVPAALEGERVDRAVALVAGISRARAARLVSDGCVRVGGRPVTGRSAPLRAGDLLSIELPGEDATLTPDPSVPLDVIHEDADVIVVDKPAGVVVHPGAGHQRATLAAGLLARYPELADLAARGVGQPDRPGIVHRLDRGTSGLLAVARSEPAFRSLSAQLRAHTIERRYAALAVGYLQAARGVVDAPIGRSTRQPTRMAIAVGGREARTTYEVLGRYDAPIASTLLALRLQTGRTHQIRVHLSAIGHPVVGDERYGPSRGAPGGALLPAGRLFLHAAVLGLAHPVTGEQLRWRSPLPADLAELIGEEVVLP